MGRHEIYLHGPPGPSTYICEAFRIHIYMNLHFCNRMCIKPLGPYLDTQSHRAPAANE